MHSWCRMTYIIRLFLRYRCQLRQVGGLAYLVYISCVLCVCVCVCVCVGVYACMHSSRRMP